jgi:flavin reductase (DIM6/NTAB) family NADH-FMN oxidoreductase RutF
VILDPGALTGRQRYQLLTSLVVPRPVAWVSTRSQAGAANLAPFSYFAALSATPFLVGVSVGSRAGAPKDTLRNARETGAFCVNIATEGQLEAMNETSGEYGPEVDEFARAGLERAEAGSVAAPYVADCPAVLECRLAQEVPLEGSTNTLLIGEVLSIRLASSLALHPDSYFVEHDSLRPVARLWGDHYALLGAIRTLSRPRL